MRASNAAGRWCAGHSRRANACMHAALCTAAGARGSSQPLIGPVDTYRSKSIYTQGAWAPPLHRSPVPRRFWRCCGGCEDHSNLQLYLKRALSPAGRLGRCWAPPLAPPPLPPALPAAATHRCPDFSAALLLRCRPPTHSASTSVTAPSPSAPHWPPAQPSKPSGSHGGGARLGALLLHSRRLL